MTKIARILKICKKYKIKLSHWFDAPTYPTPAVSSFRLDVSRGRGVSYKKNLPSEYFGSGGGICEIKY